MKSRDQMIEDLAHEIFYAADDFKNAMNLAEVILSMQEAVLDLQRSARAVGARFIVPGFNGEAK